MPTGYTADVGDGKVTEFKDFAETCLRSRGVAVMLRDEPLGVRVGDAMVVPDYYYQHVADKQDELAAVLALEGDALVAAYDEYNEQVRADRLKSETERLLTKSRYEAMLEKVRAWTPPTSEHDDLKSFMISQLEESIDFDCREYGYREPQDRTPEEYKARQIESATRSLKYASQRLSEMEEKYAEGTQYIRAFRASLEG